LRTLLVQNPEILPLDDLPSVDSTVQVTVGREAPLGSGFADVVWVDLDGQITILEVKLRANPEVRREVLAQALSYGAFLEGMSLEDFYSRIVRPHLQRTHDATWDDLTAAVGDLAGVDLDAEAFTTSVEQCLSRGSFRIFIVVDESHPQLRRSVGYVNRHSDFDIYLVEVGFHRSPDGTHEVLVPRILDAEVAKPPPGGGGTSRDWDMDDYWAQVRERRPETEVAFAALMKQLDELEAAGLVELGFGRGRLGTRVVRLPDVGKSILWVRTSGSVQFPRYPMRQLGFSDDEITGYMAQIAELTGVPAEKYAAAQEPQIVVPEAFDEPGVVDTIVKVVRDIAEEFQTRDS
jgi:hypothetical protein